MWHIPKFCFLSLSTVNLEPVCFLTKKVEKLHREWDERRVNMGPTAGYTMATTMFMCAAIKHDYTTNNQPTSQSHCSRSLLVPRSRETPALSRKPPQAEQS